MAAFAHRLTANYISAQIFIANGYAVQRSMAAKNRSQLFVVTTISAQGFIRIIGPAKGFISSLPRRE